MGFSLVGGARSRFYIRDISLPSISVGAMLRPGAAEPLFGVTADELAERHTPLADLWGASADDIHGLLFDAPHPGERIALLESVLTARLPPVHAMHPAIADAIEKFHMLESINLMVRRSGYSHRQFIALFRRAVGLSPKTYARVLRFQTALQAAARCEAGSGAIIALQAGYSDQAHFNREFLEFAGVTPATYRKYSPAEPHHVPFPARANLYK